MLGKATIHTLPDFQALPAVRDSDFFSRFSYRAKSASFRPSQMVLLCLCEMARARAPSHPRSRGVRARAP